MSLRALPAAHVPARADYIAACSHRALKSWNPGVRAAASEDEPGTISVLDVIGEDWWTGGGVTSKRIGAALRQIGDKDVTVTVNSPGGDYFEGLAIYNLLREHKGKVTVKIVGLAASAASVIAMAGDEVQIARAGFLMIHNTWVLAAGDRNAFRDVADWLEPFDAAAVDIYAARSGIKSAELSAMLDKETWLGGQSAVDRGFADALLDSDEIATAQNRETERLRAERQAENLGRLAGASRSEVRELLAALKAFKPSAEGDGKPDAAAPLNSFLSELRAL